MAKQAQKAQKWITSYIRYFRSPNNDNFGFLTLCMTQRSQEGTIGAATNLFLDFMITKEDRLTGETTAWVGDKTRGLKVVRTSGDQEGEVMDNQTQGAAALISFVHGQFLSYATEAAAFLKAHGDLDKSGATVYKSKDLRAIRAEIAKAKADDAKAKETTPAKATSGKAKDKKEKKNEN